MLIGNANDKLETKITHDVCDHHKEHPSDRAWPGCTCFSSYERKRVIENTPRKFDYWDRLSELRLKGKFKTNLAFHVSH